LKDLKNSKSPGTDGLTAEFYKFFWIDIKLYLVQSIQYSLANGDLSIEQKRGIITLIPKKDKNRLYLKNWRPITLLNVDYKVISKVLSNRLCKVLPFIIDEDQTGYIKGRFIGFNIRKIEDAIIYTEMNNLPGILLNIDFEKAFDSINWKFIDRCLESFNFGEKFRNYVKTMYHDISSSVINNGEISSWFHPKRGVRQGCPLSPYLFILAVETLAVNIRENKKVKGIKIQGSEIKMCQLADDMTCFLQDLSSVKEVLQIFDKFKVCSGLKVNTEKTKAKFIGSNKSRTNSPFNLDWTENYVQALGVAISGKEEDHYELNFKSRIMNMKNLLRLWKGRDLSLKGKIVVVNSLALSPLLYLASIIHVPKEVITEVKSLIVDFIWNGKPSKIAYDVLIQQIHDGGLKLVDFESKVKALKVIWVKRMIVENREKWMLAPLLFYKTNNLMDYFSYNQSHTKLTPKFYQDIHNYWSDIQKLCVVNGTIIAEQTIWNNRYITISNKPYRWERWVKHGICKIKDILNENGDFMSHIEINDKFHVGCNFMNALQLRQSVPSKWRSVLLEKYKSNASMAAVGPTSFVTNDRIQDMSHTTSKMLYNKLVDLKKREPACIAKWTEDYPEFKQAEVNIWMEIFKIPFEITRETKLLSFQYKLLHRLTPCKKKLFDYKLSQSPMCEFCNKLDNLQHFILFCPKVEEFWLSFFQWWNRLGSVEIPLDFPQLEECILFGFRIKEDTFMVLNQSILIAKFYIYKTRLFHDNNIDFFRYLVELKCTIQMEENICKKNNTLDKFEKYNFIYDVL
jgi:hypothetical protein